VLFSPVFAKFQQRLGHQPALPHSNVLSVRLIQTIPFQTVTHSFARRPTAIPFSFNHFRTLFTATEGVPSPHFTFAQFPYSLNPLKSTLIEMPATVDSKPLAQTLSLLDATLTKNRGWVCSSHSQVHLQLEPPAGCWSGGRAAAMAIRTRSFNMSRSSREYWEASIGSRNSTTISPG